MDLSIYRATNRITINPYSFDAGKGPGNDVLFTISDLANAAGCDLDAGHFGGPMYLVGLPARDADLIALLQLAQVIPA